MFAVGNPRHKGSEGNEGYKVPCTQGSTGGKVYFLRHVR